MQIQQCSKYEALKLYNSYGTTLQFGPKRDCVTATLLEEILRNPCYMIGALVLQQNVKYDIRKMGAPMRLKFDMGAQ